MDILVVGLIFVAAIGLPILSVWVSALLIMREKRSKTKLVQRKEGNHA